MFKYFISFACIFFPLCDSYSQRNIDSLKTQLNQVTGIEKVNTYNELYIASSSLNPQTGLDYANEALRLARTIDYKRGEAVSLNNIGVVYKNQGVYDKALDFYIDALRISDGIDDKKLHASILNNIGTVYSLKEIYDKGLIYYIESYEIFKEIGTNSQIIGALNNIGLAYSDLGKQEKALEYYTKAIRLIDETGEKQTFDPLNNVGNIYFYKKEYDKALNYYQRSLEVEKTQNNPRGQAYALSNIGSVYIEKDEYGNAEKFFREALSLSINLGDNPILEQIYLGLARIYYDQKNYKEAYETRVLYDKAKDYVYNEESSRKLARLEMAFEFQQKEKELEIMKRKQEINDLQIENSRIVILLGIMGTILLLAVGFIIFKLKMGF